MKTVRMQYKAKPEFVETNKANISKVMSDLRGLNDDGIKYSTFIFNDGQKKLNELESFKKFGAELKANGLIDLPKVETLTLVDTCYDIF